jgi:DNA-directed RNA polymerase subunit RPC12/RpoP
MVAELELTCKNCGSHHFIVRTYGTVELDELSFTCANCGQKGDIQRETKSTWGKFKWEVRVK